MNKPATPTKRPQDVIQEKTRGEIDAYLSGRGKTRIHEGARNLSRNLSDEYGNRFLVELIQNAHDAHDEDRNDGEIAVVFDPKEGEHGCLYIANQGNGFTSDNMEAITNLALSNKSVNESIGNKGIGFRSVLQICSWPEIYSTEGTGGRGEFDGYRFRFATVEDIAAMLISESPIEMATEIFQKMPSWFLPIYEENSPGLVKRFAKEGYATVVRMPLESEKAQETVVNQISELLAIQTPLHLFLDRISRIHIEREPGYSETLKRRVVDRWLLDIGVDGVLEVQKLAIGEDNYLVATYEIETTTFHLQLDASLERKEIPEAWRDWKGSARVSIAIRLGQSVEKSLLYCYLPMSEVGAAPFAGYINANFYTKLDRRSLENGVTLNEFFIKCASYLSSYLIDFLIEQNWPQSPGAVADLLCWDNVYATIVGNRFKDILNHNLLPSLGKDGLILWTPPASTYIWETTQDACLSTKTVTQDADAAILIESLSAKQRQALKIFFERLGADFTPSPQVISNWVERIAQRMHKEKAPPKQWAQLYDEVAKHLAVEASALSGKRFLLSVNNKLIASGPVDIKGKKRRAADIYFAPGEGMQHVPLGKLPQSLKSGFALLSRDVPWSNTARGFLLANKLAREYDTQEVIKTLAIVTRQVDTQEETRRQALEWVFRLWSSGRSLSEKETRSTNLWVPVRNGWCAAEAAMFGAGWSVMPKGRLLETMLRATSDFSPELAGVREHLLPLFSDWPIQYGSQDDWVRFLLASGVRDCLRPMEGEVKIQRDGRPYNLAYELANTVNDLPPSMRREWETALSNAAGQARFSSVEYRSDLHPWRMPGQIAFDGFPPELRRDYAFQIIRALRDLKREHLRFRVFRPGNPSSGPANEDWPTPLFSFLKTSPWLPVKKSDQVTRFIIPGQAWHFNSEAGESQPGFIDLIEPLAAKSIDDETLAQLREFGLRVINDEQDARDALTVYVDAAREGVSDARDMRRFRELFGCTWTQAMHKEENLDLAALPVMVNGQIITVNLLSGSSPQDDTNHVIYLVDEDNAAKKQLLDELRYPYFDFAAVGNEPVWGRLADAAPGRLRRLSEERLDVYVDGKRFETATSVPLLTDVFDSWIADFIVLAAEYKGGGFFKRTQSNLAKLRRAALSLRFLAAKQLQISIGSGICELPDSLHGAVVLKMENQTVLFAQINDSAPGITMLSRISEQLAVALHQRELSNGLDASFLRLANLMRDSEGEAPDDDVMAEALGVSVGNLAQARHYTRDNLTAHSRFAAVLAGCLGLEDAKETLAQNMLQDEPNEDAVHEVMNGIANADGVSLPELLDKLNLVTDLRTLMDVFNLRIAEVNQVVRRLGTEFKPISNEERHRRQFAAYLSQHGSQIIESLRARFLTSFDKRLPLTEYVQLREAVVTIQPNPDWFETLDDLSDETLTAHIEKWKTEQKFVIPSVNPDLPGLRESQEANKTKLRYFWDRYGKLLSAWVRKAANEATPSVRHAWSNPPATKLEQITLANQAGWLDFRILDDSAIVEWLEQHGAWPKNLPASTVYADWGLHEAEILEGENTARRERDEERRRKSQLMFAGNEYSVQSEDFHELVVAVSGVLKDADALNGIHSGLSPLADVVDPGRNMGILGGSSGGKGKRKVDSSLTDEQKKAVGLVGELWAREWIKRQHRETNGIELDDDCWVSGYRDKVLGTETGNDMLGYDFIVRLKSTIYYYEVKASIADSHAFELNPSEINSAMRFKADKDSKFRILYVANATDPTHTTITLLPNPFSREGLRKLRAVGRGSVTYEFAISLAVQH